MLVKLGLLVYHTASSPRERKTTNPCDSNRWSCLRGIFLREISSPVSYHFSPFHSQTLSW